MSEEKKQIGTSYTHFIAKKKLHYLFIIYQVSLSLISLREREVELHQAGQLRISAADEVVGGAGGSPDYSPDGGPGHLDPKSHLHGVITDGSLPLSVSDD